jgi:hypothetical protein
MKIAFKVTPVEGGYSAWASEHGILTEGDNLAQLKANMVEAANLQYEHEGRTFTEDDMQVILDLPQFFAFYKVINAKALAARIKMPQSLLAQYIGGQKSPSQKQVSRILEGVRQVGRELANMDFA